MSAFFTQSYLCDFVEVVIVVLSIRVQVVNEEWEVLHDSHGQIFKVAFDVDVSEGSKTTLQK